MIGGPTDVRWLANIEGDGTEVRVSYVETPKGERLELAVDGGDSVRLDAVALECLAWQTRQRFEAFFGPSGDDSGTPHVAPTDDPEPASEPAGERNDPESATELASITNEFAHVDVRKVATPEGDRLELVAPKAGAATTLTATALEHVAARSQEAFTELVRRRVE